LETSLSPKIKKKLWFGDANYRPLVLAISQILKNQTIHIQEWDPKRQSSKNSKKAKEKLRMAPKKRNYQNQVAPAATPHQLQHNVGKNGGWLNPSQHPRHNDVNNKLIPTKIPKFSEIIENRHENKQERSLYLFFRYYQEFLVFVVTFMHG
jgi:hypothetical protein